MHLPSDFFQHNTHILNVLASVHIYKYLLAPVFWQCCINMPNFAILAYLLNLQRSSELGAKHFSTAHIVPIVGIIYAHAHTPQRDNTKYTKAQPKE